MKFESTPVGKEGIVVVFRFSDGSKLERTFMESEPTKVTVRKYKYYTYVYVTVSA